MFKLGFLERKPKHDILSKRFVQRWREEATWGGLWHIVTTYYIPYWLLFKKLTKVLTTQFVIRVHWEVTRIHSIHNEALVPGKQPKIAKFPIKGIINSWLEKLECMREIKMCIMFFYMLQVLAFAVLSSEVMSKPLDLGGLFNPTRGGLKK